MKNKAIEHCIKGAFFLLGLCGVLAVTQNVLMKHFKYPGDLEDHLGRYQVFDSLPNVEEVLFVGTSHMMSGVSPLDIYKDYGIVSYNLGGSAQTLDVTYAILDSAFEKQAPKVVMLDASNLFLADFNDSAWRKYLDASSLKLKKLSAAHSYEQGYTENKSLASESGIKDKVMLLQEKMQAAGSALFPLYYYHSRWNELTDFDFFDTNNSIYSMGYFFTSASYPAISVEAMNEVASNLSIEQELTSVIFDENSESNTSYKSSFYSVDIPESSINRLNQIKELCSRNGAELVLIKIPSIASPQFYSSAWTNQRSLKVHHLADEMDIDFVDLLYDTSIVWNTGTDFRDGGEHLNVKGAHKASQYLGNLLKNEYHVDAEKNNTYDRFLKGYNKIVDVTDLEMTTTIDEYLDLLLEKKDEIDILFSVKADLTGWISDETRVRLEELSPELGYSEEHAGDSFAAVISQGKTIYKQYSNEDIQQDVMLDDGMTISLFSAGNKITNNKKDTVSILIDGIEYSASAFGLNIVVKDRESGLIIDSVGFYPLADGTPAYTRADVQAFLKEYEHFQYTLLEKENAS